MQGAHLNFERKSTWHDLRPTYMSAELKGLEMCAAKSRAHRHRRPPSRGQIAGVNVIVDCSTVEQSPPATRFRGALGDAMTLKSFWRAIARRSETRWLVTSSHRVWQVTAHARECVPYSVAHPRRVSRPSAACGQYTVGWPIFWTLGSAHPILCWGNRCASCVVRRWSLQNRPWTDAQRVGGLGGPRESPRALSAVCL
jgi:hypothetical protein